jgi:hypothetical protein
VRPELARVAAYARELSAVRSRGAAYRVPERALGCDARVLQRGVPAFEKPGMYNRALGLASCCHQHSAEIERQASKFAEPGSLLPGPGRTTPPRAVAAVLPASPMRARSAWVLAAITGSATLSGCSTNWMAERAQRDAYEEQQNLGMLLQRARFELHCPEAQLQVLERFQGGFTDHQISPATLVGVDGCERQAMYKRRLRRRYGHGRTTDNTKWEPATPSPAVAVASPSPVLVPQQYQPGPSPVPAPVPEQPPPSATLAPAPSSAPDSPPPAPLTRIFGAAR